MLVSRPCSFPHRIVATADIPLGNGTTIPKGTFGWLIGHTHIWNEPDVEFDGFGVAGITGGFIRTVRDRGHLIRRDQSKANADKVDAAKLYLERLKTRQRGGGMFIEFHDNKRGKP